MQLRLRKRATMAQEDGGGPWLVLGLGNPDDEYGNTRHNAGAMVVRALDGDAGLERFMRRAAAAGVTARWDEHAERTPA